MKPQASMAMRQRRVRDKSERIVTTPEGVALKFHVASMSARAWAFFIDLILFVVAIIALVLIILIPLISMGAVNALNFDGSSVFLQLLIALLILGFFAIRYGYFMAFELGPTGATIGKRQVRIRVAARDGARLTASAVLARNLLRDIEFFLPLAFLFGGASGGAAGKAALLWLLVFMLFPFFNRDRLRAGDLIAGTWVVEMPRAQLGEILASAEAAMGRSAATGSALYQFSDEELSVYGEYELQTLEDVLRAGNAETISRVQEAVCKKLGWNPGAGDERAFLEAFYAQLRAKLESDMRFGKRVKDKYAAGQSEGRTALEPATQAATRRSSSPDQAARRKRRRR